MRSINILALGVAMVTLTSGVARAQGDKRIHVNLGGGPTFNMGDIGDHFSTGWGPAVGVTLDMPNHRTAFQVEYAYRYFRLNESYVVPGATQFGANHQTHQIDFNYIANLTRPGSGIRGYVLAGPGLYYRKVDITQYVGTGIICDPFWYVCGAYPVEAVLGARGGWDWGFNVGGGVAFKFDNEAEFFIESRYHYVWGPDIEPNSQPIGQTLKGGTSNGQYMPLTFGLRF